MDMSTSPFHAFKEARRIPWNVFNDEWHLLEGLSSGNGHRCWKGLCLPQSAAFDDFKELLGFEGSQVHTFSLQVLQQITHLCMRPNLLSSLDFAGVRLLLAALPRLMAHVKHRHWLA